MPRPPTLDNILGQSTAIDQLYAMLASGRMPHGLIFHGPPGVGKFTTAVALACVLLDAKPGTDTPETHPDLHVVTKELSRYSDDANVRARKLTNIPLGVLKEHLIGPAFRSSQLGRGKVFIVDEAELMRSEGQNALLKTLEEPPADTTIVLVTSSEERLLPTIRSRCQRIAFVPLPGDAVEAYVAKHAPKLDASTRAWLIRFADGSLGRASLALEHGLVAWADALLPMLQQLSAGRPAPRLGDEAAAKLDAFAEGWVKAHANASKEAANKLAADLLGTLVTAEARHQLRQEAGQLPAGDPAAADAALHPWLATIDAAHAFRQRLNANVNVKLAAAGLAADLHHAFSP